jgi:hypothetical protein
LLAPSRPSSRDIESASGSIIVRARETAARLGEEGSDADRRGNELARGTSPSTNGGGTMLHALMRCARGGVDPRRLASLT